MSKQIKCDQCGKSTMEIKADGWIEIDKLNLLALKVEDSKPPYPFVEEILSISYRHVCGKPCLLHHVASKLLMNIEVIVG